MAENTIFVLEKANLYAGDEDPSHSNHLVLQEMKLPALENNLVDHAPGGAPIAIDIPTHLQRLESTFNLLGIQPYVATLIGLSNRTAMKFTSYGLVRDRRTAKAHQLRAIMFGQMGRVNPSAYRMGDLMHHEYSIRAITHYELYLDQQSDGGEKEIYYWSFFTSTFRVGGVNVNEELNRMLAIA